VKMVESGKQKRIRIATALLLLIPGCSIFLGGLEPPPPEANDDPVDIRPPARENAATERAARKAALEQEKRQRAEEAAAKEKAIFDEIDRLRAEIASSKIVIDKAKPFGEKVIEASRTERARAGQVEMAKLYAEAAQYYEIALRQTPSLELFDALAALPPGEMTDRAVLASCARVRPLVPPDDVLDFTGTCLDSAAGDAKKLVWPNARQDVAAYLQEERERALAAAVNAEKARQAQAKVDRYVSAAVFASGRCRFGNCLKDGWTTRTADGDVDVSCSFSNCFKDGWTARFPDGSQASTRCSFSDCAKDGWTTTFPDGSQATTRCSFSNCLKDGWSTDLPNGETITTRCSFSDCSSSGWETNLPGGKTIRCRCNFSRCFQDGATCE
jgi:hypothetical protein